MEKVDKEEIVKKEERKEETKKEENKEELKQESDRKEEKKLSKNAIKRQKKQELWERLKQEKKMAKKLKQKQEKLFPKEKNPKEEDKPKEEKKFPLELEEYIIKSKTGQRIVIDCEFDDKMTEKELKSLVQQLGYVYNANKKSLNPANIKVTGIGPMMEAQLKKVNYDKWRIGFSNESYITQYPKEDLVYLTADATETMTTIDPKCVYIIGGIVDRNRYKMITFNKAKEQGIKMAKLPLAEFVDLKCTKVLTVNHVFSCMIKYIDTKDWAHSLITTIPLRKEAKFAAGEKDKKTHSAVEEAVPKSIQPIVPPEKKEN